jgi:transposase-like protein
MRGVITDGQRSIRNAVASALPDISHQLCQFHYLREAAKPIAAADLHARKELKKQVRGVRLLERALEGRTAWQSGLHSPMMGNRHWMLTDSNWKSGCGPSTTRSGGLRKKGASL